MHIRDPNAVQALLQKIAVHDAILSDEDRAYAHSAQRIIDEQIPYDDS
jgi:hypothetical protein